MFFEVFKSWHATCFYKRQESNLQHKDGGNKNNVADKLI